VAGVFVAPSKFDGQGPVRPEPVGRPEAELDRRDRSSNPFAIGQRRPLTQAEIDPQIGGQDGRRESSSGRSP
jgi:hypothetical protein